MLIVTAVIMTFIPVITLSMACRQARDAQAQLAESAAALDSAQVEVTELKALAAERQKRFVMLNGTFKKKEDGLRERVEAAERQVADARGECEAAQAQTASAIKVNGRTHTCILGHLLIEKIPAYFMWPSNLHTECKVKNLDIHESLQ